MTRVFAVDVAWLRMEGAGSAADIVALLQLEGVLAEADARATVARRLMSHPHFRPHVVERAGGAKFAWCEEVAPSLDQHFTPRRLPAPGGPRELMAAVNDLLNQPLDHTHSPWRICLLDGSPQGSILFAQLQHCLGDGAALEAVPAEWARVAASYSRREA